MIRFTRRDEDSATETLTLVRIDGSSDTVEVHEVLG